MHIKKLKDQANKQLENGNLRNRYMDDVFYIRDQKDFEMFNEIDVSFNESSLNDLSKVIMRFNIVEYFGGYYKNNELRSPKKASYTKLKDFLSKFIPYLYKLGITDVEHITKKHLLEFVDYLLSSTSSQRIENVRSFGSLKFYFVELNKFIELARMGDAIFPVTEKIDYEVIQKIGLNFVKKNFPEINIYDWIEGGTLDTVSLQTAMLMLNYSLKELDSDRFKVLKSYFKTTRSFIESGELGIVGFRTASSGSLPGSTKYFFENACIPRPNDLDKHNRHKPYNVKNIKFLEDWFEKAQAEFEDSLSIKKFHSIVNGWTLSIVNAFVLHYSQCALTCISILTGYRVSELSSLKASNVLEEKGNVLYLISNVQKTHAGLPISRSTSDAVSIAVEACLSLGHVDKTKVYIDGDKELHLSLFAMTTSFSFTKEKNFILEFVEFKNMPSLSVERSTLNSWLGTVYDKSISELPEQTQKEFAELDEKITAHAFRHAFVDFLLRRFDGDLISAIRRCFAHSTSDPLNYVVNYIRTKVSKQVQKTAERAYTHELIMRIAGDHNCSQFSGQGVEYVRKQIDKFNYVTIDELDELVHEWVFTDMVRLVPHSYGFCMLFNERENIARCKDTKVDVRNAGNGESKLCIGCPNLGIEIRSHFEMLEQLRIVHQTILKASKSKDNILSLFVNPRKDDIQLSERMVTAIDSLLQVELK